MVKKTTNKYIPILNWNQYIIYKSNSVKYKILRTSKGFRCLMDYHSEIHRFLSTNTDTFRYFSTKMPISEIILSFFTDFPVFDSSSESLLAGLGGIYIWTTFQGFQVALYLERRVLLFGSWKET